MAGLHGSQLSSRRQTIGDRRLGTVSNSGFLRTSRVPQQVNTHLVLNLPLPDILAALLCTTSSQPRTKTYVQVVVRTCVTITIDYTDHQDVSFPGNDVDEE
jgi:predicted NAD/FAD-dependent oxidoreductase